MLTEAELSEKLSSIPSIWLSREERMCLLKYAGLSTKPIVEIGTAFGGSACILVLGSNQIVFSVDPYVEPLCNVDGYTITADSTHTYVRHVLGANYPRWIQHIMTSQCAADQATMIGLKCGLVFIDGNHDYEYVRQDVDLWLPLIQPGGYLILHDSHSTGDNLSYQAGPIRVAQELSGDDRVKLIETAYSITVWRVES